MSVSSMPQTIPFDWYVDEAVLRLEQHGIFARCWQYVARADQVGEPGQYATASLGSIPIVIVRGRDRALRAFVNVCRHRGYLLCEGDGRRETIQCPYHAWTYGLDGSLRSAPRSDGEPGFDASALGLLPVRVASWGPFVFANADPGAAPLEEQLGSLPQLLAGSGVDLDALTFHSRVEASYAANWKVCAENFLECYHCAVAHPSFSKAIDVAPDTYGLETHATFSSQFGVARDGGGGVYDADGEVGRGQFHLLYPGTTINVMPGRPNLSIGPIVPLSAERTYRYLDYFFAGEPGDDWLAGYFELDNQVGREDTVLVERVQRGIRSGAIECGALMPISEQLIAHFQAFVVDAISSPESGQA